MLEYEAVKCEDEKCDGYIIAHLDENNGEFICYKCDKCDRVYKEVIR